MRQNADILIRNITVYTQDEQRRVLPETDVAIREGKIAAIGKLSEEEWTAATVLDGTGKALFPGMQNCLLYTSPSPRDYAASRMPSSA